MPDKIPPMKNIDVAPLVGVGGVTTTALLEVLNSSLSILVGVATFVYMALKAYAEWKHIRGSSSE